MWRRVDRNTEGTGCWEWLAAKTLAGYGVVLWEDGQKMAHRVVYSLLRGAIPDGMHLDHLCRNRGCVNPWHLEPVTPEVNQMRGASSSLRRYRLPDGRYPSGASGPSGPNIPEGQRKTRARKLRLLPSVDAVLDERAAARGLTASAYVSALVMADAAGE